MAAGLIGFFGARLSVVAPLVLIIAGVALILATRTKSETGPWDIAVFIVGLLFLASASGGFVAVPTKPVVYSASISQVGASTIDAGISVNMGSIDISFSDNTSLAYRVVFWHRGTNIGFPFESTQYSFKETTAGGVLHIDADAQTYSVNVTIGKRCLVNINASSSLGGISFQAVDNHRLGRVLLSASLGA